MFCFAKQMPTMKAIPIEEHVRGVVKDLLRTRGVAHTGLTTDLNGTRKVPLKGLKYRLSVQVCFVFFFAASHIFFLCASPTFGCMIVVVAVVFVYLLCSFFLYQRDSLCVYFCSLYAYL